MKAVENQAQLAQTDILLKRAQILKSMTDFERDIFAKMTMEEKGQMFFYQRSLSFMNYKIFKRQMVTKYKPC